MTAICLPIDASGGSPSFPAAQHRVAMAALMQGRTDRPLGAQSGVRPGSDPVITLPTTTSWQVTPFAATADPGTALTVGPYLVAFTASVTGAVNAASASNPRIDRLDVQVPDDPSGGTTAPTIVYTAGVAAASPSVPAAPARSFPLATISVPKAGTGSPSVTSKFPRAAAAGGVTPCADSTMYPAAPFIGQRVDDLTLGISLRWNGSLWVPTMQSGVASVTNPGANTNGTTAITFQTPFAASPAIIVTPATGVPQKVFCGIQSVSASGFTIVVNRTDAVSPTSVHWTAYPQTQ